MGWLVEQACVAHSTRFSISCSKLIASPATFWTRIAVLREYFLWKKIDTYLPNQTECIVTWRVWDAEVDVRMPYTTYHDA